MVTPTTSNEENSNSKSTFSKTIVSEILKRSIKPIVTIVLIVLLLQRVKWSEFSKLVSSVSYFWLSIVISGYFIGQILSSFKWWLIVRGEKKLIHYPRVLKAYFIGMYVNVLGIGTVGGDMARAIAVSNSDTPKAFTFASVIADRAHGMLMLATIGTVATATNGINMLPDILWYGLAILGLTIVLGWRFGVNTLLKVIPTNLAIYKKIKEMSQAFPNNFKTVTLITLISVAFHTLQISLHQAMAYALNIAIPWQILFVTVPFVNIMSSLPISWQGLGVRENSYSFFLVPLFLTPEQTLAFGLMWLCAISVSTFLGSIFVFGIRGK
jgi:glycosyltransferase 2 family protein